MFTGCDQTGRFCGKSKTTWWKVFMAADDDVLGALLNLGIGENLPKLETLEALERFVVNVYCGPKRPQSIFTLSELRWYLFSKFQYEAEKLPPTFSALKYKIFRCHFVTMVLRRAHLAIQNLPHAANYGWEDINSSFTPILTDNLPAPLALIELSVCSCKSDCATNRCKCHKNDFICTDMCKCTQCKNIDGAEDDFEENIDLSDSDDDL